MQFSEIIGQSHIKKQLCATAVEGRIPHAQLFVGPEGCGALAVAIAYAQFIICANSGSENDGLNQACNLKFNNLGHPDLHFIYPTVSTEDVKTKPKSIDFITEWRLFVRDNPYGNLFDWYKVLDVKNKQGEIRVDDAQEILKTLALKSYEGGYKVMIIWCADKINIQASNKLLKLLEEPTDKTLIILITENEEDILATIKSRCQIIRFNGVSDQQIAQNLQSKFAIEPAESLKIAHQAQGNFNKALQLVTNTLDTNPFDEWFVSWVRTSFRARGNAAAIIDLITWSETIATLGREAQKKFLNHCIDLFRQALLLNYQTKQLVFMQPNVDDFDLQKLAPFVNGNNIELIFNELSDAIYHIERNANAKIVLTDLSIKLTRLIHQK